MATKKTYRPHINLREHEFRDLKSWAAKMGLSYQDLLANILRGWLDRQAQAPGPPLGQADGVEALLIAAAHAIHTERQKLEQISYR